MSLEVKPFTLAVAPAVLDDLRGRLRNTRWPDQLASPANDDWEYGTELGYLRDLAAYWADGFDWRAQERMFNAMPMFTAQVQGRSLHFVHQRCARADAPALLLSHGWPGSVWEFHKVLPQLARDFHVVAPSIPGYGFSEAAHERGMDVPSAARAFHALMLGLGYDSYVAQGGDWGSIITQSLGRLFPGHCKAIHINMPTPARPKDIDLAALSKQEIDGLKFSATFQAHGLGYQQIQRTRPQTLSYGLNDSPVGLLAWILEKFREWSDCDGDPSGVHGRDALLTNVMLYWVSGSIGSSMRLYYESMAVMPGTSQEMLTLYAQKIEVPTAVAQFPKELFFAPKAWCEASYNLQRYTTFSKGGHFAALERPDDLVQDIRAFFLDDQKRLLSKL